MEREQPRESNGKADKLPLYMKMYFRQEFIEIVRMIGYSGKPFDKAREEMAVLAKRFPKEKLADAAELLVDMREGAAHLKAEVRRLAHQLLGPDPAKQTVSGPPPEQPKPEPKPVEPPKTTPKTTAKKPTATPKAEPISLPKGNLERLMEQYRAAKEARPEMIALFHIGDYYEAFFEDAATLSKKLGLTLTTRDREVPMAGFPHHQLEAYLHKLLQSGERVAIHDQEVEDGMKATRREVHRVVPEVLDNPDEIDTEITSVGGKPTKIPVKLRRLKKESAKEADKPVKQPRHFVLKKYEEQLNEDGIAFVSVADVKKTTPAVAPHVGALDYILLRGDEKLLVTVRPQLQTKHRTAIAELQKLFGPEYIPVRIWPAGDQDNWKWQEERVVPVDGEFAEEPA